MMNIVQIPRRFVSSDWGGTETVILESSKRLLAKGHQTQVLCPAALSTVYTENIEGVPVTRTKYFYPYFGLNQERKKRLDQKGGNLFSFDLQKKLNAIKNLDLIHLHTSKRLGGIARHVARKRNIPYVVSLHGGLIDVPTEEAASWTEPTKGCFEWGKALGYWVGSRRVFDDAGAIICVGQKEQEETQKIYPNKKVLYLPNGVNPDRFEKGERQRFRDQHNLSDTDIVILTVGRIDPQKNQLLALEVFKTLLETTPNLRLFFIGHVTNDPYYKKLQEQITHQNLEEKVYLIPGLPAASNELLDAFKGSDIFLLPSLHEPFGIVVLEAWAAGLCVVASKVGGIPYFVHEGHDALLFPSGDDKQACHDIRSLITSPEKRRDLAAKGRKKAREEYSWDRITNRLIDIYEEVRREHPLR